MCMLVPVTRRLLLYSCFRASLPLAIPLVEFAAVAVLPEQLHSSICCQCDLSASVVLSTLWLLAPGP